jgi:thiamine-monophosphate kinase
MGVEDRRTLVDLDSLKVEGSESLGIDAARLWLGWGDWNVLAAVSEEKVDEAISIGQQVGAEITAIGRFNDAGPKVTLARAGISLSAPRLESERFAADSWFTEGIQGYIDRLLSIEIPN